MLVGDNVKDKYYNNIKQYLIDNEVYARVKDYSKNVNDISTYYKVGKELVLAGNQYGDKIINKYSERLEIEIGKKYNIRYLYDMKKLYLFSKVHPLDAQLTISHYRILFKIKDNNEIDYYIEQIKLRSLSKRELTEIISNKEYQRLDNATKNKLIKKDKHNAVDFVKNPIFIKNNLHINDISEKTLQRLILEDISSFMKELGNGFSFIDNEYKIKVGDNYNYIDLLLYNIKYKCYVVIELKVIKLSYNHIGQIQMYMNYIDKNIKGIDDNKTVGIIICKENNKYVIDYCSDNRVIAREFELL